MINLPISSLVLSIVLAYIVLGMLLTILMAAVFYEIDELTSAQHYVMAMIWPIMLITFIYGFVRRAYYRHKRKRRKKKFSTVKVEDLD